ncbi:hypothetical protein F511_21958 [Dorcoceras hygrometricum]|uniref:Uncharacterized protein n=1 Tax=Dorcoceras hygrometricum TaxID=472368 RepID=A0A2Z7BT43_9LAMI|nr:hypothetical protein F511_21958 [Dorcoceras hygrometricum]
MFLVDWAVKMRIRPPEFETSICDAKYHVSLEPSPLLSQTQSPPPPCAAARLRRKIVSGQFDEENPFVLISSVLLVQADEGVSFLVVDRIGDIYRNLSRRADVIVTTVGARHKCQQGSGFEHPFRIDRLPAYVFCSSAASPGGGSGSPTASWTPSWITLTLTRYLVILYPKYLSPPAYSRSYLSRHPCGYCSRIPFVFRLPEFVVKSGIVGNPFQTRPFATSIVSGDGRRRKHEEVEHAMSLPFPAALFFRTGTYALFLCALRSVIGPPELLTTLWLSA